MKKMMSKILETDAIVWIALTMGIVFFGMLVLAAQGCGITTPVREVVDTLNNTVQSIDRDGSGTISMQEILKYCLMGWLGGRSAETASKFGVRRFRNGRKRNDGTCSESSDS